jgi:hypothetical protein
MTIFELSTLVLASAIGSIALASVMGFITANFQWRRSRLPDATAYEDIRERRIGEQMRLEELRAEIRTLEHAKLDAACADIEAVKRQAAAAAGDLASKKLAQECADPHRHPRLR